MDFEVTRVTGKNDADDGTLRAAVTRGAIPKSPRVVILWEGGEASAAAPSYGAITLGRAATCDLVIDHRSVSRIHAKLHAISGGFLIEDLGSSNGTRVQGEPIAPGTRVAIAFGDVVEIGGTLLTLQATALSSESDVCEAAAPPPSSRRLDPSSRMVVIDPAMEKLMQLVELIASSSMSIVIHGEMGVGKELVAETIHRLSDRAKGPLLRLNCAALAGELLESELFGYERGAFTGAIRTKIGLLEAADGGTVLLDEIGEMSLSTQAKLLRVIESREVLRMGGLAPRTIDVRFLAATHRHLPKLISTSAFREDLYFRLNGATVEVPPLRERPSEILVLFERFVVAAARMARKPVPDVSPEAKEWLLQYEWPGNVRQLKNVAERAALLAGYEIIRTDHLPTEPDLRTTGPRTTWRPDGPGASAERERILGVLTQCSGNQTRAAQILGISRRTLVNRLDAYQIARPRKGSS